MGLVLAFTFASNAYPSMNLNAFEKPGYLCRGPVRMIDSSENSLAEIILNSNQATDMSQVGMPGLYDLETGRRIQNTSEAALCLMVSLREDSDALKIRVYDTEKEEFVTGSFGLNTSEYCFNADTGEMMTGLAELPFRNNPNRASLAYFSKKSDSEYGRRITGWIKDKKDGQDILMYCPLTNWEVIADDFCLTEKGLIYADEDGIIQKGTFQVGEDTFKSDDNGIIQTRNNQPVFPAYTQEGEEGILRVDDQKFAAKKGSLTDRLLKAASPAAEKAIYTSAGRDYPEKVDCIGFAVGVLSEVSGQKIKTGSVHQFVSDSDNGSFIPMSKARPGDLIIYEGTYIPPCGIYTHAALYLGDNMVLSMDYRGLSIQEIDSIEDYNGEPASYRAFRTVLDLSEKKTEKKEKEQPEPSSNGAGNKKGNFSES